MGVAVNVTLVPEQKGVPGFAAILTLAGKFGLTVMLVLAEAFEVINPKIK